MGKNQDSKPLLGKDPPSYTGMGATSAAKAEAKATPAAGITHPRWKKVAYAKPALYRAAIEPLNKHMHIRIESDSERLAFGWSAVTLQQGVKNLLDEPAPK